MGNHERRKSPSRAHVAHTTASGPEGASRVRPPEGPGEHLVEVIDKRQQFRAEVVHRLETATADHLSHNHPKHDLDLVEPGAVLGGIHEAKAMAQLRQELLATLLR